MGRPLKIEVDETLAAQARRIAALRGWRVSEVYAVLAEMRTYSTTTDAVQAVELAAHLAPSGWELRRTMEVIGEAASTELAERYRF